MILTNKFRIYPNMDQERELIRVRDLCCLVYNRLLEEYNAGLMDHYETGRFLTQLKDEMPELRDVYSKCLQPVRDRLFYNIKAQRAIKEKGKRIGKLRFKNKTRFKSFTYNQIGFKLLPKNDKFGLLYLSKIGEIPIRLHHEVIGRIKQITIKQMSSGEWYAFIVVDTGLDNYETVKIEQAIGLDVGLDHYIVDSDGHEIENPRHLKQALKKLRKEQRRLSKKQRGSKNKEKQRIIVARCHERVENQRNDFQHKVSRAYVNNYDLIVTEKLNPGNMVKNRRLARSISDASWSSLNQELAYKAENAGKLFVQVDPRNTSQMCSGCGKLVPKTLGDRRHDCPFCGLSLSRDHNASINILHRGIEKVGQELPELACGHWTATSLRMMQVEWLKQDAPSEG